MNRKFKLHSELSKQATIEYIRQLPLEPVTEVEFREHKSKRSVEQNARMWAMLTDISRQVEWYGRMLSKEDWKCIFSAALKKVDVVPNLDGDGFVAIGLYTSKMSVKMMGDLMELMGAFGAEHGVRFTETRYEEVAA